MSTSSWTVEGPMGGIHGASQRGDFRPGPADVVLRLSTAWVSAAAYPAFYTGTPASVAGFLHQEGIARAGWTVVAVGDLGNCINP
jgi:hypothetical protein